MNKSSNILTRIVFYVLGFLIMTLGIAISVKSNLGVSPVSSIPYTMTCVWGIEMGRATIFFHIGLVIIQILLLRKQFKIKNLLQVPVGIMFGYFTTFCNYIMTFFPTPESIIIRLCMMVISAFLIAFGIFMYVPADFIPLAGEGTMLAVSQITKIKFSTVKIFFDSTMVAISLIVCLIFIHSMGSVGIGTVIAALLVGSMLKMITKVLGRIRDKILNIGHDTSVSHSSPLMQIMKTDVYTLDENANLKYALSFLREKKISGAPVVDADGNLTGFLSDGDIFRFLSADHSLYISPNDLEKTSFNYKLSNLMRIKVSDIAVKHVITVDSEDKLDEVCLVLSENHLKKAPVMDKGKMIGVINRSNITAYAVSLLDSQQYKK